MEEYERGGDKLCWRSIYGTCTPESNGVRHLQYGCNCSTHREVSSSLAWSNSDKTKSQETGSMNIAPRFFSAQASLSRWTISMEPRRGFLLRQSTARAGLALQRT